MDNNILLPSTPNIDHATPEIIEEWIRLPEFVDDKSRYVTRVGQIVVQRDRVSENENGYTFLDYERGLTLFRYDHYGMFHQELRVAGDYEIRKLYHEVMLAVASNLSRLTDYAQFDDFTREQKRELGERAKETVRLVLAEFDGHSTLAMSTYDESHDIILNETEEEDGEIEKHECDQCSDRFDESDLHPVDVQGETMRLCEGCREELNMCDECGYTSFSDYVFHSTGDGNTLCDDCYREYMTETCEECGEASTDEDDFEVSDDGRTLCRECASKAERARDDWTPATWLRKEKFEEDERGFIVYKSFGKYHQPPEEWILKEGSIIEDIVMPDLDVTCGYGINVASFAWVRGSSWKPYNTWKCRLHHEDINTTIIPYMTDGKFRVARLELLHKVNQSGNRLDDQKYSEDDD